MTRPFPFFSGRNPRKVRSHARRRTRLTFEGLEERRLMAWGWGTEAAAPPASPSLAVQHPTPGYTDTVAPAGSHDLSSLIPAQDTGFHDSAPVNNPNRDIYDIELTPEERFGVGDEYDPAQGGTVIGDYALVGYLPGMPYL